MRRQASAELPRKSVVCRRYPDGATLAEESESTHILPISRTEPSSSGVCSQGSDRPETEELGLFGRGDLPYAMRDLAYQDLRAAPAALLYGVSGVRNNNRR